MGGRVVVQFPDPDPDEDGCPDCGEPLDVWGRCPNDDDPPGHFFYPEEE